MITFSKEMLFVPMYTLTVVTTPAEAVCTLTYDGNSYTSKTAKVKTGTVISYSITHATYGTTTGIITMDSNKTLTCIGTSSPSYVDVAWTNPLLSSTTGNGTLGGNSFAVQPDKERTSYFAWRAFDGNLAGTAWLWGTANTTSCYMIMYNPTEIKLENIDYANNAVAAGHTPTSGTVYGSNDGNSWTSITNFTNSTVGKGETWTISVNSSSYYKYHKLYMVMPSSQIPSACEIGLSGYYQSETTTYSWTTSIT